MKNKGYYIGYSQVGIEEAIENALQEAGEYTHCEILETLGIQDQQAQRHYKATVTAYHD